VDAIKGPARLREERLARRQILRTVADDIDTSVSYLSRVERAQQQVSLETLFKLSIALHLDDIRDVLEPFILSNGNGKRE
jgi:transcriptional regulator with XRE-family HTH domain